MAEKAAADIIDASHNEDVLPATKVDPPSRRDSIAVNIVENPLKVSFAEPIPHARQVSVDVEPFHRSESPRNRL